MTWPHVRVGDLVSSGVLALNDGYRVTNRELGPAGIPFVRGGDIGDHGEINTNVADHVLPEFHERITSKLTRPGDVAFITKGSVGRVGLLRPEQPPAVFAPQVCYWRSLDPDRLDARFVFYLLSSAVFQANLDAVKTHGSMVADYVSLSDQRLFKLPLPPILVQRAIARILGALDDKIELNRKTNETLEAIARALFKSWFVDFDPVRAKAEGHRPAGMDETTAASFPTVLADSDRGPLPTGWCYAPATELQASTKYACVAGPFGSNLTSKDYVERGVPVIRGGNLGGAHVWLRDDDFVFVAEEKANDLSGNLAFGGDVVFTQRGTLGQVAVIPRDTQYSRFVLSQSQMKMTVDPARGSAFYLAMYFQQQRVIDYIVGNGQQAGVPHINLGFLRAFKLLVPPAAVLRAFDERVGPLYASVRARSLQSKAIEALRDALLPKLMSGELRVRDAERAVEAAT
jgi:type I restriction enzyme S subunit